MGPDTDENNNSIEAYFIGFQVWIARHKFKNFNCTKKGDSDVGDLMMVTIHGCW